jgi:hypothetical protein
MEDLSLLLKDLDAEIRSLFEIIAVLLKFFSLYIIPVSEIKDILIPVDFKIRPSGVKTYVKPELLTGFFMQETDTPASFCLTSSDSKGCKHKPSSLSMGREHDLRNPLHLFIPKFLSEILRFLRAYINIVSLPTFEKLAVTALVLIGRVTGVTVAAGSAEVCGQKFRMFSANGTSSYRDIRNFLLLLALTDFHQSSTSDS